MQEYRFFYVFQSGMPNIHVLVSARSSEEARNKVTSGVCEHPVYGPFARPLNDEIRPYLGDNNFNPVVIVK